MGNFRGGQPEPLLRCIVLVREVCPTGSRDRAGTEPEKAAGAAWSNSSSGLYYVPTEPNKCWANTNKVENPSAWHSTWCGFLFIPTAPNKCWANTNKVENPSAWHSTRSGFLFLACSRLNQLRFICSCTEYLQLQPEVEQAMSPYKLIEASKSAQTSSLGSYPASVFLVTGARVGNQPLIRFRDHIETSFFTLKLLNFIAQFSSPSEVPKWAPQMLDEGFFHA
jgi:hypothetical protein